jgi:hypothetical protein
VSISSARRFLVCGAALLALAGCGSHDKKAVSGPPSDCELRAETTAKAAEVKKAYDGGKLGTAKQLAAHFTDVPRSAYLNADGTLRAFAQLQGDARIDFEQWMNAEVAGLQNDVGDAVRAAGARVRASSISTGKPCKHVIAE